MATACALTALGEGSCGGSQCPDPGTSANTSRDLRGRGADGGRRHDVVLSGEQHCRTADSGERVAEDCPRPGEAHLVALERAPRRPGGRRPRHLVHVVEEVVGDRVVEHVAKRRADGAPAVAQRPPGQPVDAGDRRRVRRLAAGFLDAAGVRRCVLAGLSMGGAIALGARSTTRRASSGCSPAPPTASTSGYLVAGSAGSRCTLPASSRVGCRRSRQIRGEHIGVRGQARGQRSPAQPGGVQPPPCSRTTVSPRPLRS